MKLSLHEMNLAKMKELRPDKVWAGEMWVNECYRLGYNFRVSEVYRTPERQYQLWASHYIHGGPWRTDCDGKKVLSQHQLRLAADVYPINCTHAELTDVARSYGIIHPWPKIDPPHYSFENAKEKPEPRSIPATIAAAIRKLERQIKTATGEKRERLQARLALLKRQQTF